MNTIVIKTIVLISEVSLFQGKNNMYSYKVGIQSSVLVNLFQRCPPLREVSLYRISPIPCFNARAPKHLTTVQKTKFRLRLIFCLVCKCLGPNNNADALLEYVASVQYWSGRWLQRGWHYQLWLGRKATKPVKWETREVSRNVQTAATCIV